VQKRVTVKLPEETSIQCRGHLPSKETLEVGLCVEQKIGCGGGGEKMLERGGKVVHVREVDGEQRQSSEEKQHACPKRNEHQRKNTLDTKKKNEDKKKQVDCHNGPR